MSARAAARRAARQAQRAHRPPHVPKGAVPFTLQGRTLWGFAPDSETRRGLIETSEVMTAADAFNVVVHDAFFRLIAADEHAGRLRHETGRYHATVVIDAFDPPDQVPLGLPYRDRSGRVVVIWQDERGTPLQWFYERRTRALARLSAPERRAFVEAVRQAPDAAQEIVRKVRQGFARALRGMQERDRAMRDDES